MFVSKSKEVIKRIPEADRTNGIKELDLDLDWLPLEQAFGVHWCQTAFSLCYKRSHSLDEEFSQLRAQFSTLSHLLLQSCWMESQLFKNFRRYQDQVGEVETRFATSSAHFHLKVLQAQELRSHYYHRTPSFLRCECQRVWPVQLLMTGR